MPMSSAEQIVFLSGAGGVRQYWEPLSQRLVSPVAAGEYLARELPDAKLIVVEDADHFLARDRVEEVTLYIAEFLSS